MKKKLIAAVTSLAMVATMVPATAFAAVDAGTVDKEATTQVAQTKDAAQAKAADELSDAAQDFVKAMNAYGSATTVNSYSETSDANIKSLCNAYKSMVESSPADDLKDETVQAKTTQLKSLVRAQWGLRIKELEKSATPLEGTITSADVNGKIGNLKDDIEAFYLVTPSFGEKIDKDNNVTATTCSADEPDDDMYVVLGKDYLNIESVLTSAHNAYDDAIDTYATAYAVADAVVEIAKVDDPVTATNYLNAKGQLNTANAAINAIKDMEITRHSDQDKPEEKIVTAGELKKKVNTQVITVADAAVKKYEKQVTDAQAVIDELSTKTGTGTEYKAPTKGTIDDITDQYNAAKKAFDGLSDMQKTQLTVPEGEGSNEKFLKKVADDIDAYNKGTKKEAEVQNMLTNLPNGSNASDALTIAQADKAYAGLTGGANGSKSNVTGGGKLADAVAAITNTIFPNGNADATAVAAAIKPVQDMIAALPAKIETAADKNQAYAAKQAKDDLLRLDKDRALAKAFTEAENEKLATAYAAAQDLDAADQAAVDGFVAAVKKIAEDSGISDINGSNPVDRKYEANTANARAVYDKLTDEQKRMVAEDEKAKEAYEKLLIAEANVTADSKLVEVAKLIKAVPKAETLDVTDTAAVQKVKDAEAAVNALPKGSRDLLITKDANGKAADNDYLRKEEIENYEAAVKKVKDAETKTAAQAVIDAIKALPKLPAAFESKDAIDAAKTPMEAARKAYDALTETQKRSVSNFEDLKTYEATYQKLLKKYVNTLYADVAKIDVTKELSAADAAKIAELQAYVDDKYIETKDITDFNQETYDALVKALKAYQAENASLENATIAPIADQAYTGKAIEPAVTVTDKTGAVVDANEYTVIYSNNVNVGEATVVVAAKSGSVYTGTVTATFQIIRTTTSITSATVGDIADKTYTGSAIKPAVSVKLGNDTLKAGTDYTVAYKNNTKLGKATVTITGTGNYTGTITKSFIIKPAKESITSVKGGKGKITVAYKTQNKAKYRIITKKSGTKAKGTNTLATSKTVKNLKKGSYQVKVRAYKVIDGKTYYGAYSAVKTVKVK